MITFLVYHNLWLTWGQIYLFIIFVDVPLSIDKVDLIYNWRLNIYLFFHLIANSSAADSHPYLRSTARSATTPTHTPASARTQHGSSSLSATGPIQLLSAAVQVKQHLGYSVLCSKTLLKLYSTAKVPHFPFWVMSGTVLSQVPAGVHAEQPVTAFHDAVGTIPAQLSWCPGTWAGQASVKSGLSAALLHPAHSHFVWTTAQPALWHGGLPAHWHSPAAGKQKTFSPDIRVIFMLYMYMLHLRSSSVQARQGMNQHSNMYSGQVQQHGQSSYYSNTQSPSSAMQQVTNIDMMFGTFLKRSSCFTS